MADTYRNLGELIRTIGQEGESLAIHQKERSIRREVVKQDDPMDKSQAIRERLASTYPSIREHQVSLWESLTSTGLLADRMGRPKEAVAYLRRGIKIGETMARKPAEHFGVACIQARLHGIASQPLSEVPTLAAKREGDRAMVMLRRAVSAGYRDLRSIRSTKNLDSIRDRPDFQEWIMDLAFPESPLAK
jgi:hypothetical protein